jgi:hypothetical protein
MAGSEYNPDFFSNLPSRSYNLLPLQELDEEGTIEAVNLPSRSYNLHPLQELNEEGTMEAVNLNFFHKPRSRLQRSSRMQQLSAFLPTLRISPDKSKHSKDTPLPPLSFDQNASRSRPPTRNAPPAPLPLLQTNNAMLPLPKKRLQKSDSPNRLKSLPNLRSESPARTVTTSTAGNTSRRNSILAMIPGQAVSASSPISSRPNSFHSGEDYDPAAGSKLSKRKSFLPGGRSRSRNTSKDVAEEYGSGAWVNAGDHKIDYNLALLINGEKVKIPCAVAGTAC